MTELKNDVVMNQSAVSFIGPEQFDPPEQERLHQKQRLTAAFRLLGKFTQATTIVSPGKPWQQMPTIFKITAKKQQDISGCNSLCLHC